MTSGVTYSAMVAWDLQMYGVHYAEIVYHLDANGEPIEDYRVRVDPMHFGSDDHGTYFRMGPGGDRYYLKDMPGKFVEQRK